MVNRYADTSRSICWEISTACRLFLKLGSISNQASEEGVSADKQEIEYEHCLEEPAGERAGSGKEPVG